MKKLSLVSLAIAIALVIAPEMLTAQSYNFDFSSAGNDITITGIFTTSPSQNLANLPYDSNTVTSFSGNFSDPSTGVVGSMSLVPLASGQDTLGSPSFIEISNGDVYSYDNQFYPNSNAPGAPGTVFDYANAVAVYISPAGGPTDEYIAFLWGNPDGSYEVYDNNTKGSLLPNDPYMYFQNLPASSVTVSAVPEGSSSNMLVLSVLLLAGSFFYKGRKAGLI
jgi:hypothetical protein